MKPIARLVVATVGVALVAPAHAQIDCAAWNTKSFFLAAEVSDVTRCLQTGMDPEARSESGYTPLHWAASSGNAETIEVLIAAGANPAARSESGWKLDDPMASTPLHTAARSGKAWEGRNHRGVAASGRGRQGAYHSWRTTLRLHQRQRATPKNRWLLEALPGPF